MGKNRVLCHPNHVISDSKIDKTQAKSALPVFFCHAFSRSFVTSRPYSPGFWYNPVDFPRIPSINSEEYDFTNGQIYVIMATSGFSAILCPYGKYLHIEHKKGCFMQIKKIIAAGLATIMLTACAVPAVSALKPHGTGTRLRRQPQFPFQPRQP